MKWQGGEKFKLGWGEYDKGRKERSQRGKWGDKNNWQGTNKV
jgi:hypothetical protein